MRLYLGVIPASPIRQQRSRRYFAAQAAGYSHNSAKGLWAWIRGLETPVVMDLLGVKPGEKILDAGCGSGHYTGAVAAAGGAVTALDIEPAMIASLKSRLKVETVLGDLASVPLDPVFDKIVCAGVLEFVADPAVVVANLAKGLRAGGPRAMVVLVLARCVPGVGYWAVRRTNGIDMPMFSRRALDALAAAGGLRVIEARRAGYNWVARFGPAQ